MTGVSGDHLDRAGINSRERVRYTRKPSAWPLPAGRKFGPRKGDETRRECGRYWAQVRSTSMGQDFSELELGSRVAVSMAVGGL